ncbi:YjgN family protein [Pelagibius sp. Alg239-R121]|uniref:YjgN family protein n=1 Tax=Pelagibius sp. Alg239-R121 TaxID=2993448 RepID=UPI0024A6B7C7|nr:DUF898 family protein [Pelagibius sp. Alg239-R121]
MPFKDDSIQAPVLSAQDGQGNSVDQSSGQFAVYDGQAGPITKIAAVNAILGLFTLGIYRFWGKTRMRQHLWSRITILGDRLEYTGTPKELLLGFLFAAVIMGLISIGLYVINILIPSVEGQVVVTILYVIGLYFLTFFAIFRARRYRLTRTQWRGVRFSQTGTGRGYAFRAMGLLLLTGITLGLCYPYMQTRLQEYRTNNTWFGNRNLVFDGLAYDLFWKWVLALVLYIPTLGISILWYNVNEFRYFTSRTRFSSLSFSSSLSTMNVFLILLVYGIAVGVLWIALSTAAESVVDFGSLSVTMEAGQAPDISPELVLGIVVMALIFVSLMNVLRFTLYLHPMIRAVSETLMVTGSIDVDDIKQSDAERGSRGEGFADVLDVGAI